MDPKLLAEAITRIREHRHLRTSRRETQPWPSSELAKTPEANIIKLPNISASLAQLKQALKELQDDGYELPDYPEEPSSDAEQEAKERYDTAKGSNVNPVLREGNSDRRAPKPAKEAAQRNPPSNCPAGNAFTPRPTQAPSASGRGSQRPSARPPCGRRRP